MATQNRLLLLHQGRLVNIDHVHNERSFEGRRDFPASDNEYPELAGSVPTGSTAQPTAKQKLSPAYVCDDDNAGGQSRNPPQQWGQRQGAAHGPRDEPEAKGQGDRRQGQGPGETLRVVGRFVAGRADMQGESTIGGGDTVAGRYPPSGQHGNDARGTSSGGGGGGGSCGPTSPQRGETFSEDRREGQSGTEGTVTRGPGTRAAAAGPPQRAFHDQQQQVRDSSEKDRNQHSANADDFGDGGGRREQEPLITGVDIPPRIKFCHVRSAPGGSDSASGGCGGGSGDGGTEYESDDEPTGWPKPFGAFGSHHDQQQHQQQQQQQQHHGEEKRVRRGEDSIHIREEGSTMMMPYRRLDGGNQQPAGAEVVRPTGQGPVEAMTTLHGSPQITTSHNRGVRQDKPWATATGREAQQRQDTVVAVPTPQSDSRRRGREDIASYSTRQEKNQQQPPPPPLSARSGHAEGHSAANGRGNGRADCSDSIDGGGANHLAAINDGGSGGSRYRAEEAARSAHSRSPSPHRGVGPHHESGEICSGSKLAGPAAADASMPPVSLSIEGRSTFSPSPSISRMAAVVDAAACPGALKSDRGSNPDLERGGKESAAPDREPGKRQEAALRAFLRGVSRRWSLG